MSNYYHRDENGNWFVGETPVEFGASMEIAYKMGQIDLYHKLLKERLDEVAKDILQTRDT